METTWITSLGGPLILIPQSACRLWGGAPPNYPDQEGDYGCACAVDGYIGLIDVEHAKTLVLGDYPARTTFSCPATSYCCGRSQAETMPRSSPPPSGHSLPPAGNPS